MHRIVVWDIPFSLFLLLVPAAGAEQEAGPWTVSVDFATNKKTYYAGECVLAAISLENRGKVDEVLPQTGLSLWRRYQIRSTGREGRFSDWLDGVGLGDEHWRNRNYFSGTLRPGRKYTIVHLLSTRERDGVCSPELVLYSTSVDRATARELGKMPVPILARKGPLEIEVRRMPETEPIRKVLSEQQISELCSWTCGLQYQTPGRADPPDSFDVEKVLDYILSTQDGGVMFETTMYAYLMAKTDINTLYRDKAQRAAPEGSDDLPAELRSGLDRNKVERVAFEFLKRYPKSWLAADVCKALAELRLHFDDKEKAVEAALKGWEREEAYLLYANDGWFIMGIGKALFALGQLEKVEPWLAPHIERSPKDKEAAELVLKAREKIKEREREKK
jgi:hypothetical protein